MFVAHSNLRLQVARAILTDNAANIGRYHRQMPGTGRCEVLLTQVELAQILGARSLPRGSLETYLPYLVPTSYVTVVFMCDDGRRSARAAATAEAMGYTRARVLDGGVEAWKKSGGKCYGGWSLTGKDYGEKLLVEEEIAELSVAELHGRLAAGERVCILDSRPLAEYRATHLPSARSAPIGQIASEAPGLIADPKIPVVANCAGRTRSIIAAHLLRRMKLANPVFATCVGASPRRRTWTLTARAVRR